MTHDVVVVGGGLSGLSVAHRLLELDAGIDVRVLEASDRAGGILGTVERDGFVVETGPDSILTEKRAALDLASRLGIGARVVSTNDAHRGAYVVCRGRLERVPEGFSLMAPTKPWEFLASPILSTKGKLRALLEPLVPGRPREDESLASFVSRRFGRELFERLAQPLAGGIYGGDPHLLSLRATMPRFVELERAHGSVIRGMLAAERRAGERAASGARYSLFAAFDRGMQVLIDALVARLRDRVRTRAPVSRVERAGTWRVELEDGQSLAARHLVIALPSWRAAALVTGFAPRLGALLRGIAYGSAATVTMAWPRSAIEHALDAFGVVVPAIERRSLLAATFASVKWPGRAPPGHELIRAFIGGAHAGDACDLDDDTLVAIARRELDRLLGVHGAPRFSVVRRHVRAMPQYHLGHLARVDAIERAARGVAGLSLAGNAYRGVGIPDTIAAAERVAAEALSTRTEREPAALPS